MRRAILLFGLLLALALGGETRADVTGPARVIDGDTIVVDGEHVRLQGIDAPEKRQTCTAYGQEWPAGEPPPSG
jgi:endonuclease YncB( thermonuclease family)